MHLQSVQSPWYTAVPWYTVLCRMRGSRACARSFRAASHGIRSTVHAYCKCAGAHVLRHAHTNSHLHGRSRRNPQAARRLQRPGRLATYPVQTNLTPTNTYRRGPLYSEELAQIAVVSADTARAFGIEPRVAMLSYSTLDSGRLDSESGVKRASPRRQACSDMFFEAWMHLGP